MFKRILVAIDGSATSNRGLKTALDLARDEAATLDILHVVDDAAIISYVGDGAYVPGQYLDAFMKELADRGRNLLAKAHQQAQDLGVNAKTILIESGGSSIAQAILHQARKLHSDVIVLGTHGRRGVRRILMGSDAEAVLREARVPVLLVRAPGRAKATARAVQPTRGAEATTARPRRTPVTQQPVVRATN